MTVHLPFPVKFKIAEAIRAMTEPDGDKYVKYRDGLTDATLAERLAAEFGAAVNAAHVAGVRKDVVGHLRKFTPTGGGASKGNTFAKDSARVKREELTALRAEVALLTERMSALETRGTYVRNGSSRYAVAI